jgi:hypothetical protein
MNDTRVLVTITIDTECDHDLQWARSNPLKFDSVLTGIPARFQPVFEDVGAVPTYLLTVEVMENKQCVDTLRQINGRHELGTHLHSAFIEPEKKFHNYAGIDSPDFQRHCAPDIEYEKLKNLTELFVQCFGYAPASFRAGRFGAGENTIRSLARLGYSVDTSVTPHIRWKHPDGDVDYRRAPEQPYFPDEGSLITPSGMGGKTVIELPVTMKKRFLRGPRWFRPWFSSVDRMKDVVDYHTSRYRDRPVILLNMMFHSMEVTPGASPYTATDDDVRRYLDDLHSILSWCGSRGYTFVSAREAGQIIRETMGA